MADINNAKVSIERIYGTYEDGEKLPDRYELNLAFEIPGGLAKYEFPITEGQYNSLVFLQRLIKEK